MKKIIILPAFVFTFLLSMSQTPLPEGGFEMWTEKGTIGKYEEPTGNWWTSLNALRSLGGPVTLTKTTDFYSGVYAAKLETKKWGTLIISGLLASGRFVTKDPFIIQGQPFSDKPLKFKGYYKYTSVNSDSAAIFAMLTRYNTSEKKRDTIATAGLSVLSSVTDYTAFDLDFKYTSSAQPDSIDVVFSSSGAGADFKGQEGSTLIIDNVLLDYGTGVHELLTPESEIRVFPNPSFEKVQVNITNYSGKKYTYVLYAMNGSKILEGIVTSGCFEINLGTISIGKYLIAVYEGRQQKGSAKFEIAR